MWAVRFRLMVAENQSETSCNWAASHPFALRGAMKRCGSSRTGSIKRATRPPLHRIKRTRPEKPEQIYQSAKARRD
jgi:hypothetical protein